MYLKKYSDAIEEYNLVLQINPGDVECIMQRGVARHFLGDKTGACNDWTLASDRGSEKAGSYKVKFCQ